MTLVAYMSHPIGPMDDLTEMTAHQDNVANAHAWFRRLIKHTRWALMAPWLAYLTAVGNTLYGPRALTDQITLLERSDLLVQVGGWVSPHMTIECNHATRRGIPIVDMTDLGAAPVQEEFIAREIMKRAKTVSTSPRRRIWMPPLDEHDVDVLRTAELTLQADPSSNEAAALIHRIVSAAMRK